MAFRLWNTTYNVTHIGKIFLGNNMKINFSSGKFISEDFVSLKFTVATVEMWETCDRVRVALMAQLWRVSWKLYIILNEIMIIIIIRRTVKNVRNVAFVVNCEADLKWVFETKQTLMHSWSVFIVNFFFPVLLVVWMTYFLFFFIQITNLSIIISIQCITLL